jgi:hypothetical protein
VGAGNSFIEEGFQCLLGFLRFDPPNAAEACQFATGLNRWSPSVLVLAVLGVTVITWRGALGWLQRSL